jgi:hypothetical protein
MRYIVFGVAFLGLAAAGCGEGSIQDAPVFSEDSAQVTKDFSEHDLSRIAEALTTSAVAGHCQVLHLFGSPRWVETGVCVVRTGTQCRAGGARTCFKGLTRLDALLGTMCAYRVDLSTRCSLP